MTERYVSLAGPTMHTGWMKKISILEQQMVMALRSITELQKKVKAMEDLAAVANMTAYVDGQLLASNKAANDRMTAQMEAALAVPIKRGPGRPRKNPQ